MRQAIHVKYLGPTNYSGSRWKARAAAGSITVHQDYSLGPESNAERAANALAKRLGWEQYQWIGGTLHDGSYVFVPTL